MLRPRTRGDRRARARRDPRRPRHRAHVPVGRPYALEAGIDDPVVCYQGAVVAEPVSGRGLRHVPIPLELARETIAALEARVLVNCYVGRRAVRREVTPEARRYATSRHLELQSGRRSARVARASRRRSSSSDRRPDVLDVLDAHAGAFRRPALHLEVAAVLPRVRVAASVTKAAGLDFLAEHLGFARERTVAFGDGENDIELVELGRLRRRRRERPRTR